MQSLVIAAECAQHCDFIKSYFGLMTDLPHICLEITLTLIQDVLGALILWPIAKRWFQRYRRQIHEEIDTEHGIEHHDVV